MGLQCVININILREEGSTIMLFVKINPSLLDLIYCESDRSF